MRNWRKLGLLVAIVLLHVLAIYGLMRAFVPDFTAAVEQTVLSSFTVTVTTPPPPPPPKPAPKAAGAEGAAGKKALPKEITAPKPKLVIASPSPAPRASSSGSATTSGARDSGDGTGAGRHGSGTGAGGSGSGSGGGAPTKPSVRSGDIDDSRDFPIPAGGRQTRFGKRVIVTFTVTVEGRARDCSVQSSGVDADATARVCSLVIQRIRFNPARRGDGTPVEARYGYQVTFNQKSD
jgi:periplasmic protein TonB